MVPRRFIQIAVVSTVLITPVSTAMALAVQSQRDAEVTAIIHRGEELNHQGKYNDAIIEFKKALDIDKHSSHALFRMAEAQFELNDLNAALSTLGQALKGDLRPTWLEVWSYLNIGKIYDIRGQRDRAVLRYHKAADTADDSFSAQAEAKKCLKQACQERTIPWP